jgi:hypothetical protein
MTASPARSVRAIVAGLTALAVVTVGCAAEPAADDHTDVPTSAPAIDEPDDASPDDADDAATGSTPAPSSPTPTYGTSRPSTPDTPPASTKPAAKPVVKPAVITDGRHAGRLISITTTDVTVTLVRILTGDEAIAAAKADGGGVLDDDGTLPNDIYIQDLDRVVTIPVAGDGGFRIYDCTGGCEMVGTTLTALASGQAIPYGGPNAVINLTVDQGVVVSLEEQYLP